VNQSGFCRSAPGEDHTENRRRCRRKLRKSRGDTEHWRRARWPGGVDIGVDDRDRVADVAREDDGISDTLGRRVRGAVDRDDHLTACDVIGCADRG
jgi:hypothetical protein